MPPPLMVDFRRQDEIKTRRFRQAFYIDIPPMSLDNPLGNRQAQAGASCGPAAGFLSTVKTLENMRKVFRADALAGVGDFDHHTLPGAKRLHLHGSTRGGMA